MPTNSFSRPTGARWLFTSAGQLLRQDYDLGFGRACVYWDADPQREIVMGDRVRDYDGAPHEPRIEGKGTMLTGDLLGDWREELIVSQPGELRIFTTTIPAAARPQQRRDSVTTRGTGSVAPAAAPLRSLRRWGASRRLP